MSGMALSITGPCGLPVGFGTWALGETDWGPMPVATAKNLLATAWEAGFRHFDTAESYGNGRSEQLIGQALRRVITTDRESISLASKSVVRDPSGLTKRLHRSLRRLGTDYLDVYYIHWPREGISLLRAVEELHRQREAGSIRYIGLCNIDSQTYREIEARFPVDALQAGYNFLWRPPAVALWNSVTHPAQVTRIAYSPLAQGLLARPFPEQPVWREGDHRSRAPLFAGASWKEIRRFADQYLDLCTSGGLLPAAVSLWWIIGDRDRDAAIVGGRTPEHLHRLVRGLEEITTAAGQDRYERLLPQLDTLYTHVRPVLPDLPNMFGYTPRPAGNTACRGPEK